MPQPEATALRIATLLTMTLFCPAGANAASEWEVFHVSGDVQVTTGDGTDLGTLQPGDRLETPVTVETLHGSRATLTHGDDVIHIEPWSRVDLPEQEEESRLTEVIQSIGTAIFGVDRRPGREFQVTTPFLVTLVKGTAFEIEVSPAGASVAVTDGVVNVSSRGDDGESRDVRAGESASVAAAERGASPEPITVDPLVSTPSGLTAPNPTPNPTPEPAPEPAAPGNAAQAPGRANAAAASSTAESGEEDDPAGNGDFNGDDEEDDDDDSGSGDDEGNSGSGGNGNGNSGSGNGNGNSGGNGNGNGGGNGNGNSGGGDNGSDGDGNGNSGGKGGGDDDNDDDGGHGGRGGDHDDGDDDDDDD